ncbi:hypothetical protein FRC14_007317 [Serendipita sp. 396]|nr:hypothetical protein FRC14_007317 [Serendipita sp. 396]KAG8801177.1 hypothetical protein FRC16_001131 [Serendipita sp. 398]KAG8822389.1 hypothetical protein FRC19_006090 [Serendipita sp. 401]KAG8830460.1 hypothetical protein FRC18_008065 [Serendipita sp. 400]KAG8856627.1 hypothetical protein FRB91_000525 [Serendipita sp. 411]KAG8870825.1 hypothetical protein FRC20_011276 [Serendipita sp. 405]KAG9054468.1 hypothetical protein FS842_005041 [Serendipita sp. 407]
MSSIDFSRDSVLIICDMQEEYRRTVHHFSSVLATALRMIRLAALLGIPVFVTEGRPSIYGSTVHEIKDEIARLPLTLFGGWFTKTKYFGHSVELTQNLTYKKFTLAIICGVEAHIGIRAQAGELMNQGMTVNILLDGISSRNKEEVAPFITATRDKARSSKYRAFLTTSEDFAYRMIDHQIMLGNPKVPIEDFLALIQTESQSISTGLKNLLGNGDQGVLGDSSEAIE